MNANDTRNEALNILREVADNGLFISDAAGKAALPQKGASDLDIRFILNLVRGTVEHESILEAVLKRLVTAKPGGEACCGWTRTSCFWGCMNCCF